MIREGFLDGSCGAPLTSNLVLLSSAVGLVASRSDPTTSEMDSIARVPSCHTSPSPADPLPGPPHSSGTKQKGAVRCQHGWVLLEHAGDSFHTHMWSPHTSPADFPATSAKDSSPRWLTSRSCVLREAAVLLREKKQADAVMEKDALKAPPFISQCC